MKGIIVSKDMHTINSVLQKYFEKNLGDYFQPFAEIESAKKFVFENQLDVVLVDCEEALDDRAFFSFVKTLYPHILTGLITRDALQGGIALQEGVNHILFKPFIEEDVAYMLDTLSLLCAHNTPKVFVQTFPNFDVFVNSVPVVFQTKRAKELLAYLVFRRGALVPAHEIISHMFEEFKGNVSECSSYRMALKALKETLQKYNISYIVKQSQRQYAIVPHTFSCDYYSFLEAQTSSMFDFQGAFMTEYTWAEDTLYALEERKAAFLKTKTTHQNSLVENVFHVKKMSKWSVFNQLPLPVVVGQKDPIVGDLQPVFMNESFCKAMEFEKGEDIIPFWQIKNSFYTPVHEEDVEAVRRVFGALKVGEKTEITFRLRTTKTKKYISFLCRIYKTMENGIETYYLLYFL